MEEKIEIGSDGLILEGLLKNNGSGRGIVITHPHPQYGGSMHNNVVYAIDNAFAGMGFATLKFNFRGTGLSEGFFDNGIGEQHDVQAAVDFLRANGMKDICIGGYSFGAWVSAMAAGKGLEADDMVLVAPPVGFVDFSGVTSLPALKLVISSSNDQFAPFDLVRDLAAQWNPGAEVQLVEGADHFYAGFEDRIISAIRGRFQ